ncbi:MAG TPA: MDR family MFS transporter [Mycobacteriales bacterium]|nr:MDR family MFS transporter [Mycobacteriales bacterium]
MFADRLSPKVSVSVVYVLALFMTIMDTTIVNVALPQLGRDFGVPAAQVGTVVVGYLVSLAVFMPASGWLGDRFGTRRVFLAALVFFTAASALCGIAPGLSALIVFRVLQGVGGGMLAPVGMAMLFRTFPPHERVRASRILIVPTAFAPAIGPVLGGLLVTDLSWRWAFYVNVPIGIAGLTFAVLFLREQKQDEPGEFDLAGFVLAGAGLGSLMFALSEGPGHGWSSPEIVACGAAGVVLLALLVRVELRVAQPMLDLRLFTNRLFADTTLVIVLGTGAFLGSLFLVALFYQDGFRVSALQSGLSTFPEAIGIMTGAQLSGRIYPRIGPRRLMMAGLIGVSIVLGLVGRVPFTASLWEMRGLMLALGLCMSQVFVPAQAAAFATISGASTGRASTMFNAGRQLSGAVGVAVLSTVISAVGVIHLVHGHPAPNARAYHLAFLTAAAVALFSAFLALRINDADAAPSMRRPDRAPSHAVVEDVAQIDDRRDPVLDR